MTSEQHALVRKTFARVLPFTAEAARYFYQSLFELDPSLRALFPSDTEVQGRKLIQALAVIVKSVDRLDAIYPELEQLALRHKSYGVSAENFETVKEALLMTLRHFAGDQFSAEAEAAWRAMYQTVADVMLAKICDRHGETGAKSA
jgi:methyl-accepting chemotaxis protein